MTATKRSRVDDILAGGNPPAPVVDNSVAEAPVRAENSAPAEESSSLGLKVDSPKLSEVKIETKSEPEKVESSYEAAEPAQAEHKVDEYGTPVEKHNRTYTDEDVNRMVRERLARAKLDAPQPQPVIQKPEQATGEPWEQQLESFVETTIEKRTQREQQKQAQAREVAIQQEFESRFTSNMGQYKDFRDVVGALPITDSIMIATRSLDQPASFLYAAAKAHPDEIKRIASMADPYAQMTAVGRLEERMRKSKATTSAPRPLQRIAGDVETTRDEPKKKSIEELINEHANSRPRR